LLAEEIDYSMIWWTPGVAKRIAGRMGKEKGFPPLKKCLALFQKKNVFHFIATKNMGGW